MKLIERQLIEAFNNIEKAIIQYLSFVRRKGKKASLQIAETIQQSVIGIGESIEEMRDRAIPVEGADSVHREYVRRLGEIVHLLEDFCELLYSYATDFSGDDNETENTLHVKCGEIALAIRFEIKIESEEVFRPEGLENEGIYRSIESLNNENGNLYKISVHTLSSYLKYKESHKFRDIAIVSQGPVDYQKDFTAETMYYYRKLYPNVMLIISTWKGEVEELFHWKMESIGVTILENEKPMDPGAYNINMQIISSRNGVEKAAENPEIRYVLKTRNDQRYYHPGFLQYLRNLIGQYPAGEKAEARLIYMGEPVSMLTVPFHLTDFMIFGTTDMLRDYWSEQTTGNCFLDYSKVKQSNLLRYQRTDMDTKEFALGLSPDDRAELEKKMQAFEAPESILVKAYYTRFYSEDTGEDIYIQYWKWLKDYVIIADTEAMQWVWDKYEYRWHDHNINDCNGSLDFFSWLDLYLNGLKEVE